MAIHIKGIKLILFLTQLLKYLVLAKTVVWTLYKVKMVPRLAKMEQRGEAHLKTSAIW